MKYLGTGHSWGRLTIKSREGTDSSQSCFHENWLFGNLENKMHRKQEILTVIWSTIQAVVFVRNQVSLFTE